MVIDDLVTDPPVNPIERKTLATIDDIQQVKRHIQNLKINRNFKFSSKPKKIVVNFLVTILRLTMHKEVVKLENF